MLVARHEPEIGGTTNVADHPEFASRKTTKVIDGATFTGWFTEDFTLKELKTLRAKERIPDIRPNNTKFDGKFEIPTFQEVLDLRAQLSRKLHRQIGVYPETKHPSYFRSIGLPLEPKLVSTLNRNGLNRKGAPVFVQSFEIGNLQALNHVLKVPLVQLLDEPDLHPAGDPSQPSYGEMATPAGLRKIATYADGVGPWKNYIIPRTADDCTGKPTSFVKDAHRAGLVVHPYTFRRENTFTAVRAATRRPIPPGSATSSRRSASSSGPGWTASSPTTRTTASGPAPSIAVDAAGRAPRRLPAPVRAARRAAGGRADGRGRSTSARTPGGSSSTPTFPARPGGASGSCRSRCGSRKG